MNQSLTCTTLRCDSPKFNTNPMPRRVEMSQSVSVSPDPAELLATTAKGAAGHAEPEVFFEVARGAVRQACERAVGEELRLQERKKNRKRCKGIPEVGMWPVASCWRVRVCSQGRNSSSHAFTSDCRAEDIDCITESTRDLT